VTDREPAHHLATCADCRRFFNASTALQTSLRRDAAQTPHSLQPHFERGILQAVHASRASVAATASAPRSARAVLRWMAGLGAAGAAAVIAFTITFQREAPRTAPEQKVAVAPEEVAAIVDSAAELSDRWWNSVVPSATSAIQENALQQEVTSVYADARSALDFLALNFLPVAPDKPTSTRDRRPSNGTI
jgi:predicted anti-sigma-YlaC factor YlaD